MVEEIQWLVGEGEADVSGGGKEAERQRDVTTTASPVFSSVFLVLACRLETECIKIFITVVAVLKL